MKQALFESWCQSQGITSPLQLNGADTRYRYLSCVDKVTARKDLVHVPLHACITADSAEALAERLAFEKGLGSESSFAPFIDMFPTLDDLSETMPRFWKKPRLATVLAADGGQLERRMQNTAKATPTNVNDVDSWALACADSRSNYLDDFSYALTPLLDMLNHDPSVCTRARIENDGELVLTVDKTFDAGTEVFISYGDLTNLDTLCDYGFVSPDNPCNVESLLVKLIRHAPVGVLVDAEGSINLDAIAQLRSYIADTQGEDRTGGDDLFLQPISESNEMEVYSFLASYLQEAVDDANLGAKRAKDDNLVATYLSERAKTLRGGLAFIESKFPGIEY